MIKMIIDLSRLQGAFITEYEHEEGVFIPMQRNNIVKDRDGRLSMFAYLFPWKKSSFFPWKVLHTPRDSEYPVLIGVGGSIQKTKRWKRNAALLPTTRKPRIK